MGVAIGTAITAAFLAIIVLGVCDWRTEANRNFIQPHQISERIQHISDNRVVFEESLRALSLGWGTGERGIGITGPWPKPLVVAYTHKMPKPIYDYYARRFSEVQHQIDVTDNEFVVELLPLYTFSRIENSVYGRIKTALIAMSIRTGYKITYIN